MNQLSLDENTKTQESLSWENEKKTAGPSRDILAFFKFYQKLASLHIIVLCLKKLRTAD